MVGRRRENRRRPYYSGLTVNRPKNIAATLDGRRRMLSSEYG
jgi:hypothetical protein